MLFSACFAARYPFARKLPLNDTRPASSAALRILLVEDHEDSLRLLSRLLQLSGYEVCSARNANEARRLASAERIDLLVSDLALPDGSGIDLMRELGPTLGVGGIALTGRTDDGTVLQCRQAGFTRHLDKPVLFEDLLAALQQMASGSNSASAAGTAHGDGRAHGRSL